MDPATIIGIVGASLALINELLAYTPDGYPKSIFQVCVFTFVHIKRRFKKRRHNPHPFAKNIILF